MNTPQDRLARALVSLEGLSVGDAFGERFFHHRGVIARLWLKRNAMGLSLREEVPLGPPPWPWTDDTAMALSVVAVLRDHEAIDQDRLARRFAEQFRAEPRRGYGPAMHKLLPEILRLRQWRDPAHRLFSGQGSFGNGAAMRVAPLGAYFADDLRRVADAAQHSAEVTHAHPEGIAGAIAVAAATAWAWRSRQSGQLSPADFLDRVLALVPYSEVRAKIRAAADLSGDTTIYAAADLLGNGHKVTAQDTVPLALWCAAHHLDSYEEALWTMVSALGDMDTNCAIAGGIVAAYTGIEGIPAPWRANREPLPEGFQPEEATSAD